VLLSDFSIGVPVNPINEAFGRASRRYFAYPYVINALSFLSNIFAENPYWLLCASSAITMILSLSDRIGYFSLSSSSL